MPEARFIEDLIAPFAFFPGLPVQDQAAERNAASVEFVFDRKHLLLVFITFLGLQIAVGPGRQHHGFARQTAEFRDQLVGRMACD